MSMLVNFSATEEWPRHPFVVRSGGERGGFEPVVVEGVARAGAIIA
jgi:hypothetical protein